MFPFGAIFAGDPAGNFQKGYAGTRELQQGDVDRQAQAAFGQSLQNLYQQMVPGSRPMGAPPGAPSAQGPQQQPSFMQQQPQGAPQSGAPMPQPRPPGAPGAPSPGGTSMPYPGESWMDTPDRVAQPPRPPMSIPGAPQGPPGGPQAGPQFGGPQSQQGPQAGPQAGPGGPQQQGGGPLNLQQIVPAVQKALGPNADPKVFAAAVNKYLPLMTAQAQSQWREAQSYLHQQQIQLGHERLQQGEERLNQSQQKWQDQQALREKSLDLRARQVAVSEARQKTFEITNDKRWQQAEQRLAEAKKMNQHRMVMDAVRALHLLIQEKIAEVNAGISEKRTGGYAGDIKMHQEEMLKNLNLLKQAVDQEAQAPSSAPASPQSQIDNRFPRPGQPGREPGDAVTSP